MPYALDPEVAGELGENTVLDPSSHPPVVSKLEYEIAGWLGDDLITSFPVYLVSPGLLRAIEEAHLSGYFVNPNSEVTVNEQVVDDFSGSDVLEFKWIEIEGKYGESDLFLTDDFLLGLSDTAWQVFSKFNLSHCDVEPIQ